MATIVVGWRVFDPRACVTICLRGLILGVIFFIVLVVLFWCLVTPCRPPLGSCGRATTNGIRTLDLLDDANVLTKSSLITILCGTIAAELNCLETFFQRCLSRTQKQYQFYLALHLEGSTAMHQFCENINNETDRNDSTSTSTCWHEISHLRADCIAEFNQSPGGHPAIVMDSIFDDSDLGVFDKEFCWSLREAYLCGLGMVRTACGDNAAKTLHHLATNVTKLIFTEKCDDRLLPEWTDSTIRLATGSSRLIVKAALEFLSLCVIIMLLYLIFKASGFVTRWVNNTHSS